MALHAMLKIEGTVPAYPLGKPVDGRDRFGMTPEQAKVYRWLVLHRSHTEPFVIYFRDMASIFRTFPGDIHRHVQCLQERGWIKKTSRDCYTFVEPIKHYPEPDVG